MREMLLYHSPRECQTLPLQLPERTDAVVVNVSEPKGVQRLRSSERKINCIVDEFYKQLEV